MLYLLVNVLISIWYKKLLGRQHATIR